MSKDNAASEPKRICPICHIGQIRTRRTSHAEWHEGQLIVVPNVTADICDFCGETVFQDDQVWRLDQLLRYGTDVRHIPYSRRSHRIM